MPRPATGGGLSACEPLPVLPFAMQSYGKNPKPPNFAPTFFVLISRVLVKSNIAKRCPYREWDEADSFSR